MKVAILSESPADEAALRVIVAGLVGGPVQFVAPGLRARGWPSVVQVLPAVIRHLHFNTDADALAVVVDSDDSVVHTQEHEAPQYFHPHCRLCHLRAVFRRTAKKLPVREPTGVRRADALREERIFRGIGVAVPAIEAWLLCGLEETVKEATWADALREGKRPPYLRPDLKWRLYGTERPSLSLEIERMTIEARRHARDTRRLEFDFPGFAALATEVREWRGDLTRRREDAKRL